MVSQHLELKHKKRNKSSITKYTLYEFRKMIQRKSSSAIRNSQLEFILKNSFTAKLRISTNTKACQPTQREDKCLTPQTLKIFAPRASFCEYGRTMLSERITRGGRSGFVSSNPLVALKVNSAKVYGCICSKHSLQQLPKIYIAAQRKIEKCPLINLNCNKKIFFDILFGREKF